MYAQFFTVKIFKFLTENKCCALECLFSDESELSWLEPELKLKDFQLGLAWLVTFSSKLKIIIFPVFSRHLVLWSIYVQFCL